MVGEQACIWRKRFMKLANELANMKKDIHNVKTSQAMKGDVAAKLILHWEDLNVQVSAVYDFGKGLIEGDNAYYDINRFDYGRFAGLFGMIEGVATKH